MLNPSSKMYFCLVMSNLPCLLIEFGFECCWSKNQQSYIKFLGV